MRIGVNKCKCGNTEGLVIVKNNQTGYYCTYCGKFIKWLNKDEKRIAEYQSILRPTEYIMEVE